MNAVDKITVMVWPIIDGDRNHDFVIRATQDGLELDGYMNIPWKWILTAEAYMKSGSQTVSGGFPGHVSAQGRPAGRLT